MRFSIIVTHYQGVFKDSHLQRLLNSLAKQDFTDFEVIVVHDGPLERKWGVTTKGLNVRFVATPIRYNDWGHSLRDYGIKLAEGEFLLHTNADNVYYDEALKELDERLRMVETEVLLCAIRMMGMFRAEITGLESLSRICYDSPRDYAKSLVLLPVPKVNSIDLMQACISRRVWQEVGGWYDKKENSDGRIIQAICEKYPWAETHFIIGEHY